jgi:hypothetical protein
LRNGRRYAEEFSRFSGFRSLGVLGEPLPDPQNLIT